MTGYEALRTAAAAIDLSARARIKASGEDRKRLLHAMTTNHVENLTPGQGLYAFFLNAQGRVLADAVVLCFEDHLLLDLEPEVRERIYQHLDKFIIADDVTLEDVTDSTAEVAVEGPQSGAVLEKLGAVLPPAAYGFGRWGERVVVRASSTGAPGFRILLPAGGKGSLLAELALPEAAPEEARIVRLEHGVPRYGEDFSEALIAHETGLLHALHFQKGCYLGQEIVERVRSRGLVQRHLVALRLPGPDAPARDTPVEADGKPAGKIMSAAWSPALNAVAALGFLRVEAERPGVLLTANGAPVQVVQKGASGADVAAPA
jgi:tRNA-modifying protein YgfZ